MVKRLMVGGSQNTNRVEVASDIGTMVVHKGQLAPVAVMDFGSEVHRWAVGDGISEVYQLRSVGGACVFFLDTLTREEGTQMLVDGYRRRRRQKGTGKRAA